MTSHGATPGSGVLWVHSVEEGTGQFPAVVLRQERVLEFPGHFLSRDCRSNTVSDSTGQLKI